MPECPSTPRSCTPATPGGDERWGRPQSGPCRGRPARPAFVGQVAAGRFGVRWCWVARKASTSSSSRRRCCSRTDACAALVRATSWDSQRRSRPPSAALTGFAVPPGPPSAGCRGNARCLGADRRTRDCPRGARPASGSRARGRRRRTRGRSPSAGSHRPRMTNVSACSPQLCSVLTRSRVGRGPGPERSWRESPRPRPLTVAGIGTVEKGRRPVSNPCAPGGQPLVTPVAGGQHRRTAEVPHPPW